MCCSSISASFLVFSIITVVAIFTLTMINMIFSIITPKKYETFLVKKATAYESPISLFLSDELNKAKTIYDKFSEEIKPFQEKSLASSGQYTEEKIEELNHKVKRFKNVLMAFGIASFSVMLGFVMFFVPIYASLGCCSNCAEDCDCNGDCNCDCYLCIGITPIKRIILFYSICSPTIFFSFVSFWLTVSKKSTYNEISSMEGIKDYMNRKKRYYSNEYEYDYFGDSVSYNDAQFIVLLIILIVLVLYPLVVWLTSSKEEMNPPIVVPKKKVPKKVTSTNISANYNTNSSAEISIGLNVGSTDRIENDYNYNSHPPQPQYLPPPQPQYLPPPQPYYPPQPHPHHYPHAPSPPPQPHYYPPPQPHPHHSPHAVPPPPQPHHSPHAVPPPPQPHYYPPPQPHPHHSPHAVPPQPHPHHYPHAPSSQPHPHHYPHY